MSESCCSAEAENASCELPSGTANRPAQSEGKCPECGQTGKPVQGQTVKALLSVSLRQVSEGRYRFCRTQNCPVVYFSADGGQIFTVEHVREVVYQKQPDGADTPICYCFQHKVGDLRALSLEGQREVVADINAGIQADQCACDLRNPQGACCLGNVRALLKELERPASARMG
ncbi:MAG: hypothetical protein M1434_14885 [Chloroflexi bacterium]|nr:hypothetical protein [Chloroflexota bacterium]MCL5276005.1 hypothetical protein [Chloroflexota bacterium]